MDETDISCIICLELAIDARNTECCNIIICGICIQKINKCPYCRLQFNKLPPQNVPISRMAKQVQEKKYNDKHILITSVSTHISKLWDGIEEGHINLDNIKKILNVVNVEDLYIVNIITNVLTKFVCSEIRHELKLDTALKFNDITTCLMNCIKCKDLCIEDKLKDINIKPSTENILTYLTDNQTFIVHQNVISIIVCSLCDISTDKILLDTMIKTLIMMSLYSFKNKSKDDVIDLIILRISVYINLFCLDHNVNYIFLYEQLNTIYDKIKHCDELKPVIQKIFIYAKDIKQSISTVVECDAMYDDINIFVGTRGYWNVTYKPFGVIPKQFITQCTEFEQTYKKLHEFKKINWNLKYGSAEIEIEFSKTITRTIVCNTAQMMILLLFNDKKIITLKDIIELTHITKEDIAWYLLTLCDPSVNILCKKPNVTDLLPNDTFRINYKYNKSDTPYHVPLLKFEVKIEPIKDS